MDGEVRIWPLGFKFITLLWDRHNSSTSMKLGTYIHCFETCSYNLYNLIIQIQISLTTGNLYLACLVIQKLYNATLLQRISKRVLVGSGS